MNNELICGLTEQQIQDLKLKHHFLFQVSINDGQTDYHAICTEPTLEIMKATKAMGKDDEIKGSMVIYDNCVLAADDAIKNRFTLKVKVIEAITAKMTAIKVTTKKLLALIEEGVDELGEGSALIKSEFNIDPSNLKLTEFAELHAQAIYLEKRRLSNNASMMEVLLTNQAEAITESLFHLLYKE